MPVRLTRRLSIFTAVVFMLLSPLTGCAPTPDVAPTPTAIPLATEITMYGWADDLPQEIFDQFKKDYGVTVNYLAYPDQETAIAELKDGKSYDIVVLGNEFIPGVSADGLLATMDYRVIQNFRNISPNFRDLAFDPHNQHSIPFDWGIWGFMYHKDAVKEPLEHWEQLWSPEFAGKIRTFPLPRYMIGMTLKTLGYSVNSEDPAELEAARQKLMELRPNIVFADEDASTTAPYLLDGSALVGTAGARDVLEAQAGDPTISFVLPEEGTVVWGDNFTVPASSTNQHTAFVFLNYLLQPEISAKLVAWNFYATPSDAARPLIDPTILNNPAIFPPNDLLKNAEVMLPLSPKTAEIQDSIWNEFVAAGQ
ncbi:MAG TPA: spermidine/putrescine ABC transporter substrate-binding protein [Phototrophicaceae bacterium]|nr:spermidine/putrescine ABC transporter substrate-binding protein [Phototrophicaceae bacterium]